MSAELQAEVAQLRALVARLRDGMRAWASDEDGVHYAAWDAYADASEALGYPRPCFDCGGNALAHKPDCDALAGTGEPTR